MVRTDRNGRDNTCRRRNNLSSLRQTSSSVPSPPRLVNLGDDAKPLSLNLEEAHRCHLSNFVQRARASLTLPMEHSDRP